MQKTIQELAHEEKLRYYKEWRARNKDKVRQHNENFWLKKAKQKLKESVSDGE